ncbi:putative fasciclin-like arabinogalactan protein [Helianthus annuus]|uniref:Fasciclin-like arabinogalactan protein n=1 Tax=Helianthus annuus TaxID=4232 RepID=A0A251U8D0_HELAN|nr:fasciclin-like arabinogalactan protein 1 [Helianthus annuus]KAF5796358.1 putative fasciclin-like arabinogalactan protein [Helianthus annuus]KAJ0539693.1 putative fasciclin-like arabinogalactan protein [Helianthus annuus]KAJ0547971.1 putative fasciclin-like arabinogalactan protein [Helianthus annuus]KAJ0554422.1 putative fasciclin-like arabinogalactan protein [Helianthus annuus]KAJ0720013.1 putative fasciclin-like arabinogalactan protein [Helianthus annuus]
MQLRSTAAFTAALISTLLFLLPSATVNAHNITSILNKFPDFSTFNHYLTLTHLADDINNRQTITVCAVDNAGMADLLSKHLSIYAMKNVLSLHVLLDYFGAKKLHQITNGTALAATMFQATGTATGSAGFVNITDLRGGKVGFGSENSGKTDATFVKSLQEVPYNISVIQISSTLPSVEAEAPVPEPAEVNITSLMSAHGCRNFAEALLASDAMKTYADNIDGGLSVFCPLDDAFKGFAPKFKNLTVAGKQSLLEYHGVPVYQSMSMLKSSNGLMNTLATDGAEKYDFTVQNDGQDVTIKTKLVTAKIVGTLIDQQPLIIFTINKVLLPEELFKNALSPAPAPAPEADAPVADSPKASKKKKHKSTPAPASSESPADSPDGAVADQEADGSGAPQIKGFPLGVLGLMLWFGWLVV